MSRQIKPKRKKKYLISAILTFSVSCWASLAQGSNVWVDITESIPDHGDIIFHTGTMTWDARSALAGSDIKIPARLSNARELMLYYEFRYERVPKMCFLKRDNVYMLIQNPFPGEVRALREYFAAAGFDAGNWSGTIKEFEPGNMTDCFDLTACIGSTAGNVCSKSDASVLIQTVREEELPRQPFACSIRSPGGGGLELEHGDVSVGGWGAGGRHKIATTLDVECTTPQTMTIQLHGGGISMNQDWITHQLLIEGEARPTIPVYGRRTLNVESEVVWSSGDPEFEQTYIAGPFRGTGVITITWD